MPASAILPLLVLLAQPRAARPDVERDAPAPEATKPIDTKKEDKKEEKEVPPVVTHHELRAGGRLLKYTATTGLMPPMARPAANTAACSSAMPTS